MKIIEKLTEMIEEEVEDAVKYAKCALKHKEDHPKLADTFYDLSVSELDHMNMLHRQVVQIIDDHRKMKGDPPADMMAIYEYLHAKHMDKAAEAKMLQGMYNGR